MTFLGELKIFFKNILHTIYLLIGTSLFLFIFGVGKLTIFGKTFFMLLPTENSFSVQAFNKIRLDLLPPGVQLVVTNPMSAFVAQISLSILLGFLLTIPVFLYKIILYLQPALLPSEKKVILWALLPLVLLFFAGCAFSYFILVPATFKILFPFASLLGAVPFFLLDEFISYVLSLMMVVGVMFLLPLFMVVLSSMGIIKAEFWKNKWQHAVLFFLIISAIITPDGTGVTMVMLFLPLALFYYLGYFFANKLSRQV